MTMDSFAERIDEKRRTETALRVPVGGRGLQHPDGMNPLWWWHSSPPHYR